MLKIVKNNRGFSLIELISVMAIATVLIFASGMVISVYFRRYKQLTDYIDLQTEAMKCLSTIRNGYPVGNGEKFYGVANAKALEITGSTQAWNQGSGIKITPWVSSVLQGSDMVHFFLDGGVIKVKYSYKGIQSSSARDLFPIRTLQKKMQVTRFTVSNANLGGSILNDSEVKTKDLALIKVNLQARVLVRDAALARDRVYKTVDYSTYMVRK